LFIPNVTHSERAELEAKPRDFYALNYPDIDYRGIVGFVPVSPRSTELSIQPCSEQDFYIIVHYVEPLESNAAAIELDLFSSASRRATIDQALATWAPALTNHLRLVQETDPSAYSGLLMHPGIPLVASPGLQAQDVSSMVIWIPSLLARVSRRNEVEGLAVYL
jgi:hypothetical protein